MNKLLLIAFLSGGLSLGQAQGTAELKSGSSPTTVSGGCVAVKDVGSHAFRNIMLAGVAGALISKRQYEVVDAVSYPAKVGQKFHGNDLQTIQTGGTKVVILGKKYSSEELMKACHQ